MSTMSSGNGYSPFEHPAVALGHRVCCMGHHRFGFGSQSLSGGATATGIGINVRSRSHERGRHHIDLPTGRTERRIMFDDLNEEEARCANTGLHHRSSIAEVGDLVGFRSDCRQTA